MLALGKMRARSLLLSFHLHEESLRVMNDDFALFRQRLAQPDTPFREEIIGRVMQIFLYDL